MPHCLITGASGFVGTNLVRHVCRQGWTVRALVRPTSDVAELKRLDVALAYGSLQDAESVQAALRGVDVVFHLAGRTKALDAAEFHRDNAAGVQIVAETCAAQDPPPVLVMTSSLAAGGAGTFKSPRREDDPPAPVSHYGRSKLAGERAAAEFADRVPITVIRPPIVFGPGDKATLQMFRGMRMFPVHPTPGFTKWPVSLVYAGDLCAALTQAAVRGERLPAPGATDAAPGQGVYYVAAERNMSYGEFGRLGATSAGWIVAALPLPKAAFWVVGGVTELVSQWRGKQALVNFDKVREIYAPGWVCSDEKIRRQLDYRPSATVEEQMADTVAWYRAQGWL
ncbi:MAG: NAD-dependent epimerase/dehydratase family protein [Planctomycetales bacterium]|nr:NAD-dependent epimerase/dehydratase family protein [Planctomycetales bacterium]